jgi:hypothetical protein
VTSAQHRHDFADRPWRDLAYCTVLTEASTVADLTTLLDREVLIELWRGLYLPPLVRDA